jgi:putative transposase
MKPDINHYRKSIRLRDFDYSLPGEYFVTICTHNRECIFGEIKGDTMILNTLGVIAKEEWLKTKIIRNEIDLDEFIIMPNHIHGIIIIKDEPRSCEISVGTHGRASLQRQRRTIGALVAGFKSAATKRINEHRNMPGSAVWQKRYYDHIIRNDKELNNVRDYILNNILKWSGDTENPEINPA